MTAVQIYLLMLVVATTVLASRYTSYESVSFPPWRTPRGYRLPESDETVVIPHRRTPVDRSSTRYGTANSPGHDSARSSFQKRGSAGTRDARSAKQAAEPQSKTRKDFTWTSYRNAKSEGLDCARSSFRRSPMTRDVCSHVQSAELQKKDINMSYLPPLMIPFQHSSEPEQEFFRQFEARGPTTKYGKSTLRSEGSSVGPSLDEDFHEAAQVLSAFHSFERKKNIDDSCEHEKDIDDSCAHEKEIDDSYDHEDINDIYDHEVDIDDSYDHEDIDNSCENEEANCDFFDSEEANSDSFEHEASGDEYEDLVHKSDIVYPEYQNILARFTSTDTFHLDWPIVDECRKRMKYIYSIDSQGFYLNSWQLPENVLIDQRTGEKLSKTFTWVEARNQCRKRCMDLISFETSSELGFYSAVFRASNLPFVWTSGRICDYKECANIPGLEPLHLNGWFWAATGERLPPTNAKPPQWSFQPWSPSGISNDPQPDNAEFAINGKNESCLALMNNVYGDGIAYHDVACYHKKYFTCEDSPALIDLVYREHGVKLIRPHTVVN